MEICDLNGKKFNFAILKNPNEMQENRQFTELRNKINKQNEYFNREIGTLKKN